jgi:hypothetical protein
VPRKQPGEDQERRDHEAAALVQRCARDPQEHRECNGEQRGPEDQVQSERLALKEEVAGDAEEQRRREEREGDPISIAHRDLIQP